MVSELRGPLSGLTARRTARNNPHPLRTREHSIREPCSSGGGELKCLEIASGLSQKSVQGIVTPVSKLSRLFYNTGRRLCQSVSRSNILATRSSFSSANGAARICKPIGRPAFVNQLSSDILRRSPLDESLFDSVVNLRHHKARVSSYRISNIITLTGMKFGPKVTM